MHGLIESGVRAALVIAVTSVSLTGCYLSHRLDDEPRARDAGPRRDGAPDSTAPLPTRDVDLLFVIDDSDSMTEEQVTLVAEIPRLLEVLGTGDFDSDGRTDGPDDFRPVASMRAGVVTTDMGSGEHLLPTCDGGPFGDDGVLRTRGVDFPGCMSAYPRFLTFIPGGDALAYATSVACLSLVGTGGCGFEQPLEAALKALSPSAPTPSTASGYVPPVFYSGTSGHGDGRNEGFLRPGSVLAVILLTDDDDCSVSDAGLFDGAHPVYTGMLELRCFRYPDALHPVARFVTGLAQLRRDPERLVVSAIAGVPADLVPAPGEPIPWNLYLSDDRDPRMIETLDPEVPGRLVPSCSVPGRGVAYPPIRILETLRGLEARGARVDVQSICQDSFAGALLQIIAAIGR